MGVRFRERGDNVGLGILICGLEIEDALNDATEGALIREGMRSRSGYARTGGVF